MAIIPDRRTRSARSTIDSGIQASSTTSHQSVQSAPVSRKHGTDDYHGMSKFVEAMRNPNWRRRGADETTSESTHQESSVHEIPAAKKRKLTTDFRTETSDDCQKFRRPASSDHICSGYCCTPSQDGNFDDGSHHVTISQGVQDMSTLFAGPSGFCDVISNFAVSNRLADEKGLEIIEVAPFSPANCADHHMGDAWTGSKYGTIRIQAVTKDMLLQTRKQGGSNLHKQLNAALAATESTPRKARPASANVKRHGHRQEPHDQEISGLERARNAVFEDPAVADVRDCYTESNNMGNQPEQTKAPHTGIGDELHEDKFKGRDAAFQKMLERLRRGTRQTPKALSSSCEYTHRTPTDSSDPIGDKLTSESQFLARRLPDSSDSGCVVRSWDDRLHRSEISKDSGISLDTQSKFNSLNPRAREFLSLSVSRPPSQEGRRPALRRYPIEALFGLKDSRTEVKEGSGKETDFPTEALPPYEPYPVVNGSLDGSAFHNTTPPSYTTALPGLFAPPGFEHLQGFMPAPGFASPPGFGLDLPMPLPAGGFIGGMPVPPLTPIPSGFVPLAPPSCSSGVPGSHTGPSRPSSQPPPPVSKPRRPDPGNQQAYEAWIEWRKANEPGYAMECKLRQQRRMERTLGGSNKSGVDKPSVATTA